MFYKLICRFWHRYNVVVCKPLAPTWVDRDELLLFAAFQILEDFITQEQPIEFDGDVRELYKELGDTTWREEIWNEVRFLYSWWQYRKYNDGDCETDTEMLHRLINTRGVWWT